MLKRQRPISPPPSIPSIPLIVDSSPFGNAQPREAKRRRVLPPSLDGRSRGWGVRAHNYRGDEEEHYFSEAEEEGVDVDDRSPWEAEDMGKYKQANNVLHELHAQMQQRLMFPSSSFPHLHHASPYTSSQTSSTFGRHRENIPTKIDRQICQTRDPPSASQTAMTTETSQSKDEVSVVTERYEDTNRLVYFSKHRFTTLTNIFQRLLGSLFLSRRRQLGVLDEHINDS